MWLELVLSVVGVVIGGQLEEIYLCWVVPFPFKVVKLADYFMW